jgi:hypothetical protein
VQGAVRVEFGRLTVGGYATPFFTTKSTSGYIELAGERSNHDHHPSLTGEPETSGPLFTRDAGENAPFC